MTRISRGAWLNLALYTPAVCATLASVALFLAGLLWPAVYVAVAGAAWGVGGSALMLLFEPALIAWLNAPRVIIYDEAEQPAPARPRSAEDQL